jgi:Domain of Unknown Function (DUF748)
LLIYAPRVALTARWREVALLRLTKSTTVRIAAVLTLLIAVYALAGFVLAPKLLRSALMKDIPETLRVTPSVGDIHVNPFLFQVEIKDFSLASAAGEKLLGFERLFVDFELSSIWHRAYSFVNIDIAVPVVNAIVAPDGSLNLLQLRPKPSPPSSSSEPLPALRIHSFRVSKGAVSYEDRSRPSAFAARLQPIDFELREFTTGVEGGRFTFSGASKLGERVEWHGHVSVQPIESDGEFQIDGLRAHTLWEYLEDRLNFAIDSGSLDLNATYKFSLKDTVDLQLAVSKMAVTDLNLRPKDSPSDWVTLPGLEVGGTTVDLAKRLAHVDSVTFTGLKLVTWIEPDGSFNLMKLAQSAAAAAVPAGAVVPAATTASSPPASQASPAIAAAPAHSAATGSAPWKFDVSKFAVKDARISAEDRRTQPGAKVLLAPLSLEVRNVSEDLAKPLAVILDTRINDSGSFSASGDVTPQPTSANLAVKVDGIELRDLQPYIAQHTSMTLLGGRLNGDAQVSYRSGKPALRLSGNVSVVNLHTVDNALREDFVNWERLDLRGITLQHAPDRLDIEQVVASKPYARVIIEPDASLNVARVLAGPAAKSVATAANPPAPLAPAATSAVATAAPPMPMSIKKVVLHAGQANFADLSVMPNFATGIQSLEGTILGLSSKPNSRAKVDIHGAVDAFSPVSITGSVSVLGKTFYTDLALSFRNMELSTFNPYSGKFAGYNITKGKLTTELHYKIDGRKLDAQHHVTIDQLEFGEKTASKDAVSLPVKLAVALLKDRNGLIDLDIPVAGSLDDPTFRLAPLIWKVFVNILEKAVTAPFALLGALFGGGPDLQFIDFQPGAAALDAAAVDKIHAMAKGLNERPQLKIEVPIGWVGEIDRPALQQVKFTALVKEAQAAQMRRKKAAGDSQSFDQLDAATKVELLTPLYAKIAGGEPAYPESVVTLKDKSQIAAAKAEFLNQALHEHMPVADADLTTLGQQRAAAVQQALLGDTQIDPARVFLVANDKAQKQDDKVRLELSLK